MKVRVRFAGPLHGAAGLKQAEIELEDGGTTGALLRRVAESFPGVQRELFGNDAKDYYSVFVNDALVPEKERESRLLKEGDLVMFLLPIAGG